ncbi:MAG: phage terminase large subunit family protein [Rhodoferax sp.]|nr:phage terminase large subunit family protein [Rhodoferax sp.]
MSNMHNGYQAVLDAMARGMEPDPNLTVDDWSDRFMVIPKSTGSNEAGPYRTARTPHAREVMRALSDSHPCKRVVVMGASQMLKTQVGLNWFMASIHQSPSNFLWLVPTGKLQKRAASRIDKTIAAIPQIHQRVAKPHSRDSNNNNDIKEYVGGALYLATAGAAANLSELSVRRVLFDEIDRAKDNVGGEGDPAELAEARQTTFERNRKTYYPSSPTIEGESVIESLYKRGTQREALAECIHCGHAQTLDFFDGSGGVRLLVSEDGKRALYPCCECGGLHEEGDKTRMFANGLWSDGQPGDGETESFTISGLFLPYGWIPWISLVRQYNMAKGKLDEGSEESMIVFYNTRLAKCWARSKESTRFDALMARAEPYKLSTVPMGGLILTAAIDTQAYRLEMKVVAWGEGMECWVVDYQVINTPPSEPETWARADELLKGRYRHASGAMLNISATFVDSGGSNTQDVYNFTASRKKRNIFAIKGHSRPDRPILSSKPSLVDINWRGQTQKHGAQLWFVGPDTAKDYLQARWARSSGAGSVHFSADLPESYYKGLTSEYRTFGYKRGRKVSWWEKKKGEANEPLDLMNYNLAAAYFLGLHKKNEHGWASLRNRLVPQVLDMFAQEPEAHTETPPGTTAPVTPTPAVHTTAQTAIPPAPVAIPRVINGRISLSGLRRGHA